MQLHPNLIWQNQQIQAPSSLKERVLQSLSLEDSADQAAFLHPTLDLLPDPHQLHDLDRAIERLMSAIEADEKIMIYGDYDADGVTSTAIMVEALAELGVDADYYIPSRFTDGYGPNLQRYQEFVAQGYQLIITVDNGVSGVEAINYAQNQGVDVIITDHHDLPTQLPQAYAIVHPRFPGEIFSTPYLAGCGVAFFLAAALLEDWPIELFDLAAIGTVADVMPLVKANRVIVTQGLAVMSQRKRPGLAALLDQSGLKEGNITAKDIGFKIAPRLNSLGRLKSGRPAVALLTHKDGLEAQQAAVEVDKLNRTRQTLVQDVYQQAVVLAQHSPYQEYATLVMVGHDWPEGILGIVAARLADDFQKPTLVLSDHDHNQVYKGSGRSVGDFNLFASLTPFSDHFINFGGHAGAIGLTLPEDELEDLQSFLNHQAQAAHISTKQPLSIVGNLQPLDLKPESVYELADLAPFGEGNPEPLFEFSLSQVNWQLIGKRKTTLKGTVQFGPAPLELISFREGLAIYELVQHQAIVKLVGSLAVNEWNGRETVQVLIKDVKVPDLPAQSAAKLPKWQHLSLAQLKFEPKSTLIIFNPNLKEMLLKLYPDPWLIVSSPQEVTTSVKKLIIVDVPSRLEVLQEIIALAQPQLIQIIGYCSADKLERLKLKEQDYRQIYQLLQTTPTIDQATFTQIVQHSAYSNQQIRFALKVFSELDFVKIEKAVVQVLAHPLKRELTASPSFQRQQKLQANWLVLNQDEHVLEHYFAN